jgi:uncharacterized protein
VELIERGLQASIRNAWQGIPIVVLEGLRASGKTTLANSVAAPDRIFSLANPETLRRATSDPRGFLESLPHGSVVDEAQLVPGLTLVAKTLVDDRTGVPGQFLFTGSSRISRTDLGGSDALAARARWLRVEPFAQCEIEGAPRDVVTALFEEDPRSWTVEPVLHADLIRRFSAGGLPTLMGSDQKRRRIDLAEYSSSLFSGDIYRTGKNREGILRLFRHLCATSSHLEVFDRIQADLSLGKSTIQGYIDALIDVFLIEAVEGYRANPAKRITEKRRLFVADPAFAAEALGVSSATALFESEHGAFVETFVAAELRRLFGWSTSLPLRLLHWRRNNNDEVDLVVERHDDKVLALEIKAGRVLRAAGRGIQVFREEYPNSFHRGFVLHSGDHVEQLAKDVWAVPFSALWMIGERIDRVAPASSLIDRLAIAREKITLDIAAAAADSASQQEALIIKRIANAERRFLGAQDLFEPVAETLEALGCVVERGEPALVTSKSAVLWHGSRALKFSMQNRTQDLTLQARIKTNQIGSIDWVLSSGDFGFSESFTTAWSQDALPELEACFGSFAEALPQIFQNMTKPAAT